MMYKKFSVLYALLKGQHNGEYNVIPKLAIKNSNNLGIMIYNFTTHDWISVSSPRQYSGGIRSDGSLYQCKSNNSLLNLALPIYKSTEIPITQKKNRLAFLKEIDMENKIREELLNYPSSIEKLVNCLTPKLKEEFGYLLRGSRANLWALIEHLIVNNGIVQDWIRRPSKSGLWDLKYIKSFENYNLNENKKTMTDNNLKAFQVLSWKQEQLIAKVLYDNGIKTQAEFRNWLKMNRPISQPIIVAVENIFRDFEINFTNPNDIPNIFKLRE